MRRSQWQHLPDRDTGRLEKVDETTGILADIAAAVGTRQRGRVQQYTGAPVSERILHATRTVSKVIARLRAVLALAHHATLCWLTTTLGKHPGEILGRFLAEHVVEIRQVQSEQAFKVADRVGRIVIA